MYRVGASFLLLCMSTLAGCGGGPTMATPDTVPPQTTGARPAESAKATAATPKDIRAAFLQLMETPEVRFHADYDATFEFLVEDGDARSTLRQKVDVVGSDSHAVAELVTTLGDGGTEELSSEAVVVDGVTYLKVGAAGAWANVTAEMEAAPAPVPANPFVGLEERRLTFMGVTDDGLYEFDINRWILGEILDPYERDWQNQVATRLVVGDFTNRVFLDESGVPHRLETTYSFSDFVSSYSGTATLNVEFSRFGAPMTIEKPLLNDGA